MSASSERPAAAQGQDEPEPAVPETAGTAAPDWQVLLLRYLPQPLGAAHVIKRLAPR